MIWAGVHTSVSIDTVRRFLFYFTVERKSDESIRRSCGKNVADLNRLAGFFGFDSKMVFSGIAVKNREAKGPPEEILRKSHFLPAFPWKRYRSKTSGADGKRLLSASSR